MPSISDLATLPITPRIEQRRTLPERASRYRRDPGGSPGGRFREGTAPAGRVGTLNPLGTLNLGSAAASSWSCRPPRRRTWSRGHARYRRGCRCTGLVSFQLRLPQTGVSPTAVAGV